MPRGAARGAARKPKNVRRSAKPNKSASDPEDADTLAAVRARVRATEVGALGRSASATSGASGGASAAPGEGSHSERPPGASSPIEGTDASISFDATLPSALAVDSHGEGAWDHAGDLAAGGTGAARPPSTSSSRSRSPSALTTVSRRASPSTATAAVPPSGSRRASPVSATRSPLVAVPAPALALAAPVASAPPATLPSVAPSPGSRLASSPAGVAVESPGTRAARLGALAAEREKELLNLAQLDKVAKAQRAAEERAYQQVLAARAKEQDDWNRKLAAQQKQLDDRDNAVRQLTTWTKKMEQDRAALQGKLADDVKKGH